MHASSRSVWRADSIALMPGAISDALLSLPALRVHRSHRQWRSRARTTWTGMEPLLGSRDIDGKADRLRKRERTNQARRVSEREGANQSLTGR
jgi:hypothetical protein